MKLKIKEEGLTGEALKSAQQFNALLSQMPESLTSEEMETKLKSLFGDVTAESFKTIADQLNEKTEGTLKNILVKQGNKITELEGKLSKGGNGVIKSMIQFLDGYKEKFAEIKKAKSGSIEMHFKTVTSISGSTSVPSVPANPYFPMPTDTGEFVDIQLPKLFILDIIDKGETTSPALLWTEQGASVFGAAIVSEGSVKPFTTKKAIRRVSQYAKIAAVLTITEELEKDVPKLATEIKRLFTDEVMRTQHNQILADVIAAAPGYVNTALNGLIQAPDNYGAIGAAVAQIQALNFEPDFLAINPNDFWRMNLTKDSLGRYNIPPFVSIDMGNMRYAQLTLVVNPAIAVGQFLVGQAKTYKVDVYEDYTLRIGYINDDFARNQYSAVGEVKQHSYIATNRVNAWCYAAFDTIKALIQLPAQS